MREAAKTIQAKIIEVTETWGGSEVSVDVLANDTVLPVYDSSDYSDLGGQVQINGRVYSYLTKDDDTSTITLSEPLVENVEVDTEIYLYPVALEKRAMCQVDDYEDPEPARIKHGLKGAMEAIIRGETEYETAILKFEKGEWVVDDIIGATYEVKGEYVDITPDDLPEGVGSDGSPPVLPLDFTLRARGSLKSIYFSWPAVPNADPVTYRLHVRRNGTPILDGSYEVAGGVGVTAASVRILRDGTTIDNEPGSTDTFTGIVTVEDQDTDPSAPPLASEPATAAPTQINSPDLAMGSLTTELLTFGTALGESLELIGLDAQWIKTGKLNADRVSVGSQPVSVLLNTNMEDPHVNEVTGEVHWNEFAGWMLTHPLNGGGTLAENRTNQISGSRSMHLTFASDIRGQMVSTRTPFPVTNGQVWEITAKVKSNRIVDKSILGESLVTIEFQSSDGTADPITPPGVEGSDTPGVEWQTVQSIDYLPANTITTLSGTVVVPNGHIIARVSVNVLPSLDASGWQIDIDEVGAVLSPEGLNIVDSSGQVVAGITDEGNAQFNDVTAAGNIYVDEGSLLISGLSVVDRLNALSRGMTPPNGVYGSRSPAVSGIITDYGLIEVQWEPPEDWATRQYQITYWAGFNISSGSNVPVVLSVRRTTDGSAPTITSSTYTFIRDTVIESGTSGGINMSSTRILEVTSGNLHRFLLTCRAPGSTIPINTFGSAGIIIQDAGPLAANAARSNTGGGTLSSGGNDGGGTTNPEPQKYVKTYEATTTKWWTGGGTYKGSGPNQYFGNTSSTAEGNRKSVMWFDWNKIRSNIGSGTILKVELYLYLFDGGRDNKVAIGRNTSTTPGSNTYPGGNRQIQTISGWDEGSGKWVTLENDLLTNWKGALTGYIIGPESNNSDSYSAAYRGMGSSLRPKVRITYSK